MMENEVGVTKDANKKSEVPNGARKDLKPLILRDISPRSGEIFFGCFDQSHGPPPGGGPPPLRKHQT